MEKFNKIMGFPRINSPRIEITTRDDILPPALDNFVRNKTTDSKEKTQTQQSVTFLPRKPRYEFKDLILSEKIFEELEVLGSMIKNHNLVYNDWGMSTIDPYGEQIAFNLYGPSGTGKTMIVEAVANKLSMSLIDINMAQLESKYVGDTGKNIEAAFKSARDNNALLFFDEADSVLGRRLSEVTQSADSSVNTARTVMLKQLEQHSGIVAFATNFAHNYDTAFVRRILKHIKIPLPDFNSREKLWKQKIPQNVPQRENLDFTAFAEQSDGFSGGDILVCAKNALFDAAKSYPYDVSNSRFLYAIENWKSAKANIGYWGSSEEKVEYKEEKMEDLKKAGVL